MMQENESKQNASFVNSVKQVAQEIDYQPGEIEEVVRLAKELTERDLGDWVTGDDAYRLRRFLAQCLPYLSPESDRALEELPNRIRDAAAEIRFDGLNWGLLAEALNRKAIPSFSCGPWTDVDVREYCERGLRDLTQYVPEITNRDDEELKHPTSQLVETGQNEAGFVPHIAASPIQEGTAADFIARLEMLLHQIDMTDAGEDVPLKVFIKWKMQAHWLLARCLGPDHPYTREFVSTVDNKEDPCSNNTQYIAGLGILEALREDFKSAGIRLETPE